MSLDNKLNTQQCLIDLKQFINQNNSSIQILYDRLQKIEKKYNISNLSNTNDIDLDIDTIENVVTLSLFKKELGNSHLLYVIVNGCKTQINWEQLIIDLQYKGKIGKAPPRKELIDLFIENNKSNDYTICIIKNDKKLIYIYNHIINSPLYTKSGLKKKLSSPDTIKTRKKIDSNEINIIHNTIDKYKYNDIQREKIDKILFTYRIHDIILDNQSTIDIIKSNTKKDIINFKDSIRVIFPEVKEERSSIDYLNNILNYCETKQLDIKIQLYNVNDLIHQIIPLQIYSYSL